MTLHINATHHLVDLLIAEDGPGELGALGGLHALGDGEDDVVGPAEAGEQVGRGLGRAGPVGDAGVRLRSEALLGGAEGDLAEDVRDDGLVGVELELEELEAAGLGVHEEEDDLQGRGGGGGRGRGGRSGGRGGLGGGREGLAALVEDDAVDGLVLAGLGGGSAGAGTGRGPGGLGRNLGRGILKGNVGNGRLLLALDEAAHQRLGLLGHGPEGGARPTAAGGGARLLFFSSAGHGSAIMVNNMSLLVLPAPQRWLLCKQSNRSVQTVKSSEATAS